LRVREHPVLGPYVDKLTMHAAVTYADIEGAAALLPVRHDGCIGLIPSSVLQVGWLSEENTAPLPLPT
jgi:hypothetical protein